VECQTFVAGLSQIQILTYLPLLTQKGLTTFWGLTNIAT